MDKYKTIFLFQAISTIFIFPVQSGAIQSINTGRSQFRATHAVAYQRYEPACVWHEIAYRYNAGLQIFYASAEMSSFFFIWLRNGVNSNFSGDL
jgi:hypothetical protein